MLNLNKDQKAFKRPSGLFFAVMVIIFLIASGGAVYRLFYVAHPVVAVEFDTHSCYIEDEFDLKWEHSVEKQWWIESYEIDGKQLLLTDAYLQTFGAGTPSTEAMSTSRHKYPDYMHYPMQVQLPYLNWMISPNIKAHLITQHREIPLSEWIEGYTNIYIHVSLQNLWKILRQDSCNEYSPT